MNFHLETVMPVTDANPDNQQSGDCAAVLGPVDATEEDRYWSRNVWHERYYTPGLDYEDYAPAYCVGYIGFAQYGGDYADAEKSLWANWERIKGDSRLSDCDAALAIRAAWDRMEQRPSREAARKAIGASILRKRLRMPSFKLTTASLV